MSGPIQERDGTEDAASRGIVVRPGRQTRLGGMDIDRVLPTKGRRTVGPWCFVDLMSPGDIDNPDPMEVGPHPHIGLSTVTWLFAGEALHGDSLGTEQIIKPGELNLMTAGAGIAHAELGLGPATGSLATGGIMGVQMWLAQPEDTRHGGSAFEHLADLPRHDLGTGEATVLIGTLGDATSPARADTPTVGADITIDGAVEVPADPTFEYAVVPLDRAVKVDDAVVDPGSIAIIQPGTDSLPLALQGGRGRVMLLGGEPLGVRVQMWWNFVARTRDEITAAWHDWQSHNEDRFGPVPSILERIDAPTPPWVRDG